MYDAFYLLICIFFDRNRLIPSHPQSFVSHNTHTIMSSYHQRQKEKNLHPSGDKLLKLMVSLLLLNTQAKLGDTPNLKTNLANLAKLIDGELTQVAAISKTLAICISQLPSKTRVYAMLVRSLSSGEMKGALVNGVADRLDAALEKNTWVEVKLYLRYRREDWG
jgi:hypothetical protein